MGTIKAFFEIILAAGYLGPARSTSSMQTESDDPFGNRFYSEIDVIEQK
jgi:hypothetical protein